MAHNHDFSRRQMLKLGAAGAAGVALAPLGGVSAFAAPPKPSPPGPDLVPSDRVGTITFTQRDVPGRLGIATGSPTMGHLGGASFPEDPNDLGPLVPLPGGWKELFEYFNKVGIEQVEFAGYGQNAANPGGTAGITTQGVYDPALKPAYHAYARTLRGFLDDNGLEAIGNHGFIPNTWFGPNSPGGTMAMADYDRLQTELEFAAILGMPFMGTGNDPTSANNRNIEPWTISGEKWEALNRLSAAWHIKMYPHNHSPAYNFLQDGPMVTVTEDRLTGAPITPTQVRGESGKRLMQHYLDITDHKLVVCEIDIFWAHVAQHQHRWRYDWNGKRVQDIFDPLEQVRGRRTATRSTTPRTVTAPRTRSVSATGMTWSRSATRRATSTTGTSSRRTVQRRTSTTRTTSRTTPRAAARTPGGPCGPPTSVRPTWMHCAGSHRSSDNSGRPEPNWFRAPVCQALLANSWAR